MAAKKKPGKKSPPKAPKKKDARAPSAPAGEGREEAFAQLRAMLKPYAPKLVLKTDDATQYYLNSKQLWHEKELFFAAVGGRKSYVSFYFFPIYMFPELGKNLSPALLKRRQGKSCFNFQQPDKALFAELKDLVKRGFDRFNREGLI